MSQWLEQLENLGFSRQPFNGDYIAKDDSDGFGPYIDAWLSDKPCPFPHLVRVKENPFGSAPNA